MAPTETERRTFIALLCRVAWADSTIADEEREYLRGVAHRLGFVDNDEINRWLEHGVPKSEVRALPSSLAEFFYYRTLPADFYGEAVRSKNGLMQVPDGPGLGVDPDLDVIREHTVTD